MLRNQTSPDISLQVPGKSTDFSTAQLNSIRSHLSTRKRRLLSRRRVPSPAAGCRCRAGHSAQPTLEEATASRERSVFRLLGAQVPARHTQRAGSNKHLRRGAFDRQPGGRGRFHRKMRCGRLSGREDDRNETSKARERWVSAAPRTEWACGGGPGTEPKRQGWDQDERPSPGLTLRQQRRPTRAGQLDTHEFHHRV